MKSLIKSAKMYFLLIKKYIAEKELSHELNQQIMLFQSQIEDDHFDPNFFDEIVSNIINETNDPMLVWKLHKVRSMNFISGLDSPLLYLLSSPNLETCLHDLMLITKLLFRSTVRLELNQTNTHYHFSMWDIEDNYQAQGFKNEIILLYVAFVLKEISGHSFHFDKICFPKKRQNLDTQLLSQVTQADIELSGDKLVASFSLELGKIKNEYYDESLRKSLAIKIHSLLTKQTKSNTISQKVAILLSNLESPAQANLELVASKLNKGISTLRRDLSNDDNSFKKIQNQVVSEKAMDLIYNSSEKIDSIALTLGYTDRTTFERFFKSRFQKSPSQLRKLANALRFTENSAKLKQLVHSFPPLSDSCKALLIASQNDSLNVQKALEIVEKDPIFTARILGMANKAIYSRKPKDLRDAIASNIGIQKLVELAILFTSKDTLHNSILIDIDKLVESMVLTPMLFKEMYQNKEPLKNHEFIDQACMFAPLGIAILCHKSLQNAKSIEQLFSSSKHLFEFSKKLENDFGLSFYSASTLLVSNWGINEEVIKILSSLDNVNSNKFSGSTRKNMIFSINTMWAVIHNEKECKPILNKVADRLSIGNFEEFWDKALTLRENFNS